MDKKQALIFIFLLDWPDSEWMAEMCNQEG